MSNILSESIGQEGTESFLVNVGASLCDFVRNGKISDICHDFGDSGCHCASGRAGLFWEDGEFVIGVRRGVYLGYIDVSVSLEEVHELLNENGHSVESDSDDYDDLVRDAVRVIKSINIQNAFSEIMALGGESWKVLSVGSTKGELSDHLNSI